MDEDLELIYVGDPMCSWCWGFAPVLERLRDHYELPVRTVVGGLRAGPGAQTLDDGLRSFLAHHWQQVHEASGQPFDGSVLERQDWVYDTEPACRSVVVVRRLAPDRTLAWFTRIQRAFYVEGRDVTDPGVHAELVGEVGVDPRVFADRMASEEARERTRSDFAEARQLGAMGFPTLVFRDGDDTVTVTRGFVPFAQLEPRLTGWLSDRYGAAAAGLVCGPDTL